MRGKPKARESEVQRAAVAILRGLGWQAFRRNTGAMVATHNGRTRFVRFAEPGAADLWAILPDGRHAEIEIKRPGERPTKTQVHWLVKTNGIGGAVSFWADNTATLERVARHVMAGGRIEYLGWSGDYDLT